MTTMHDKNIDMTSITKKNNQRRHLLGSLYFIVDMDPYIEIIIIIVLREYFWDNDSVLFFKSQKEIIYHMKQ